MSRTDLTNGQNLLPETLRDNSLCSMQKKRQDWKKAGGKDYDVEQGNFSSNYFPRVVKAGTRL